MLLKKGYFDQAGARPASSLARKHSARPRQAGALPTGLQRKRQAGFASWMGLTTFAPPRNLASRLIAGPRVFAHAAGAAADADDRQHADAAAKRRRFRGERRRLHRILLPQRARPRSCRTDFTVRAHQLFNLNHLLSCPLGTSAACSTRSPPRRTTGAQCFHLHKSSTNLLVVLPRRARPGRRCAS